MPTCIPLYSDLLGRATNWFIHFNINHFCSKIEDTVNHLLSSEKAIKKNDLKLLVTRAFLCAVVSCYVLTKGVERVKGNQATRLVWGVPGI